MDRWTLAPENSLYPSGLLDLESPPTLRVRGAIPQSHGVTIVGTRTSTEEGNRFAFELAASLVEWGVSIWSGGALGIDAAAHRGALEAGGATIVVIGSGLNMPTPPEHVPLFDEVVARGGALVSRREDDEPAATPHYHARNAVLAAATRVTVVVECGLRSGALSTAEKARQLRRSLAFVPHAPWMPRGAGCAKAIREGAAVVTGVEDVLRLLGLPPSEDSGAVADPISFAPKRRSQRAPRGQVDLFQKGKARLSHEPLPLPDGLTEGQVRVANALEGAMHLDALCEKLGEQVATLVPVVFALVMLGVVLEETPNVFRRAP